MLSWRVQAFVRTTKSVVLPAPVKRCVCVRIIELTKMNNVSQVQESVAGKWGRACATATIIGRLTCLPVAFVVCNCWDICVENLLDRAMRRNCATENRRFVQVIAAQQAVLLYPNLIAVPLVDDFLFGPETICRPADPLQACDADDTCNGKGPSCPQSVKDFGEICREAENECDEHEFCNG